MKQSTFSAVMANSIKNLLQGYTKGIRFVAVLTMLLTMGIGQAWGANTGHTINYPYFYYYNDASWSNVSVIFGRSWTNDNYTKAGPMTLVPNTEKLYFRYIEDNWNYEYNQIAVLHGSWAWPSGENKNIESRWDYATNKQHTDNVVWNHDMNYQEVHYWGGKSANSISREVPKYTTTLNIKVKESGQATYSNATLSDKPASTIKLTGTYLSSAGKTTRSEASWTTNSSCEYESVISGKVTPAYEGLNTDWTFDGWYVNSTKISSNKNYDFYQTANTTIEARFTKTVKYTVKWKVNGEEVKKESVAYNSKVTTLPTAPSIDCNGKVFVGWSNEEVTNGQKPSVLFTSASNAPAVTEATTYHAVFADQEGFDGNVDFGTQGWAAGEDLEDVGTAQFGDVISIVFLRGTNTQRGPQYIKNNNTGLFDVRIYPGNQMKITSTVAMSKINFTFSPDDGNAITSSSGTISNTIWTANTNTTSVTFTVGGTSGHRKIQSLEVITTGGTVSYSNYTTSCIPIYTITYDLNGGSGGCADAEVEKGQSHTICTTEPIRTGYTFQGWSDGTNTYAASATISNIQSDITLVAQWQANTYTVSFNKNGGEGTMRDQDFTYDVAQSLRENTFTRDKYEFAGWNTAANGLGTPYDDKEEVRNLSTTNGATITLYAQWTKLYTVTFYNIGSLLETKTQETVGGSIACPTITAPCDGYEFVGWSETAVTNGATSYTNVSCPITPTEDTELYAVYSQEAEGGGTEVATLTTSEISGAYIKNTTTQYGNYTINSQSGTWGGLIYIGENYIQISANAANRHLESPTFSGNISNITITGRHNATRTRNIYICSSNSTAQPSSGDIGRGTIASSGISNQYTDWTDVAISVSGNYTKFYVYADGGLQIQSIVVTYSGGGSTTTYTTTPNCCTPLDEITGLTFSAMTRSITVSVPDSYVNTNVDGYIFNLYNAAAGGTSTTYKTNDKNEKSHTFIDLNPDTEYYFTIIAKGSGAYCNSEEISPRESYTTLPQYTVTWNPAGGHWSGNYSDKVDTYDYQAAITQPAKPERAGYTFNGWDKTPATNMPAENLTYTAQWNIVTYTITYENLNGASNSNPTSYNVESATITLQNPGNRDSFAFGGWYSDADYTTSVTQISEGSTGNIKLYAKWIAIYSVTWMVNGSEYTEGNPDTEVLDGDKVESLPTPPTPDEGNNIYCGEVFAGWTDKPIDGQTDAYPDPLFTTIEGSPEIKQNTTFYAVFADYKE